MSFYKNKKDRFNMKKKVRERIKEWIKKHPIVYPIALKVYQKVCYIRSKISYPLLLLKTIIGKKIFRNPQNLMVNIGAGLWYKRNWKALELQHKQDSNKSHRYNRIFIDYDYDLTSKEKMPFKDNSVYLFYSEHVFEHIPDDCCKYVFNEIYRALKPGGAFRIVVPDADLAYEKFAEKDIDFYKSRMDKSPHGTLAEAFLMFFASSEENRDEEDVWHRFKTLTKSDFFDSYTKGKKQKPTDVGHHINWFTYSKLKKMLEEARFDLVYKSTSQGSRFQEMRGGNEFDIRPSWSLHMEAVK